MMKDALHLLGYQWKRTKLAVPFTFVFFAVYGGIAGMLMNSWRREGVELFAFLTDLLIVSFMSMPGVPFSREYLANPYWKNDTFTKQLAALRMLPIPVGTLALSRSLQILLLSPLTTAVFFGAMYGVSVWARQFPPSVFIPFVLVWFGFGNAACAWFLTKEWSVSGKRYLIFSFVTIGLAFAMCGAVWGLGGTHLVLALPKWLSAPGAGWAGAAAGIGAAVLSHVWLYRRLCAILTTRDFS